MTKRVKHANTGSLAETGADKGIAADSRQLPMACRFSKLPSMDTKAAKTTQAIGCSIGGNLAAKGMTGAASGKRLTLELSREREKANYLQEPARADPAART